MYTIFMCKSSCYNSLMDKNQRVRLQKRDWLIAVLFVAVIATNFVWYQYSQDQKVTNKTDSYGWLQHQIEINKLKACIDNNSRPCDISPVIE